MSKIAMVTGAGTGVGRRVSEVLSKDGIIVLRLVINFLG